MSPFVMFIWFVITCARCRLEPTVIRFKCLWIDRVVLLFSMVLVAFWLHSWDDHTVYCELACDSVVRMSGAGALLACVFLIFGM
jgi:hypothetical protein